VDFEERGSVVIYLILEKNVAASSRDLERGYNIRIFKFEIHLNCVRRSNSDHTLYTDIFYVNDQLVIAL